MTDGLNLGNVLSQAETIKGQRLQNQLLGQKQQDNVLLQNFLAQGGSAGSEGFNQLPINMQQQLVGVQQGQQQINVMQQKQKQQEALQTVRAADSVLKSKDPKALVITAFPQFVDQLKQQGIDINELSDDQVREMATEIKIQLSPVAGIGIGGEGAGQKEFEALTEGLPVEQKERAKLIKLGLLPRASNVKVIKQGGLYGTGDPITGTFIPLKDDQGNPIKVEDVAAGEATVAEAVQFGKATGASRSKFIDEGYDSIVGIDENNRNIDLAIEALSVDGAKTGYAQKFFPTIRAGSVKLNNVKSRLGLDVIGSVQFGALSEGERAMAMEVAIPTDLEPPELIEWLQEKKRANDKMRAYFKEQIDFLDQGGTIPGFLRMKERDQAQQPQQGDTQAIEDRLRAKGLIE